MTEELAPIEKLKRTLSTSLKDMQEQKRNAKKVYLLVDVSGSMNQGVGQTAPSVFGAPIGSKTRINVLREVVDGMRKEGLECPIVAFGGDRYPFARHVTNGQIPEPSGGTPMAEGINFCGKDGCTHLVVVSDGVPNDPEAAIEAAIAFNAPIDVVYIGPDGDTGADFMRRLAAAAKGKVSVTVADLRKTGSKELGTKMRGLLGVGSSTVKPKR